MARDMTKRQFQDKLHEYGISTGVDGFYALPLLRGTRYVWAANGGDTRRGQLAYLIREVNIAKKEAVLATESERE